MNDFFHFLIRALDPETGKGYDLKDLYGKYEMLIIADSDTTPLFLSAQFFYLAQTPDMQTKLAREIRLTFSAPEDIKAGSEIQLCRYLCASFRWDSA
ncbi:benzoate 4-monooxygenase cytochrome-like protein [Apiospora arundinis]|uniref:Cytochrome P450 n=1 Tax=Apiospora arundinis TaxID=335852 RepID=A0ABR2JA81_9PEZI